MMQFNLAESALPANSLNNKNLYGLLFTTQRNDQSQSNNSFQNKELVNPKELNSLDHNENRNSLTVYRGTTKQINHRIECEELCCLLKFTPLDT